MSGKVSLSSRRLRWPGLTRAWRGVRPDLAEGRHARCDRQQNQRLERFEIRGDKADLS